MNNSSLIHAESEKPFNLRQLAVFGLIGLVSYGLCLLANLPAALVWQQVASLVPSLQLTNVRGTVWSGSASAVTIKSRGRVVTLPTLHWSIPLDPALLGGKLPLSVTLGSPVDDLEAEGDLTLGRNSLIMSNVSADIRAQWLLNAIGNPLPGDVSGMFSLQLQKLSLSPQGCSEAVGRARLSDLELHTPFGSFTVGQINAPLACKSQALVANITQSAPAISSDGVFTLDLRGSYRFRGSAHTNSSTPAPLTQALAMMTREQGGAWPLNLQGRLY